MGIVAVLSERRYLPILILTLVESVLSKFPCMNDGTPVLLTQGAEFKCECKRQFYGPFCEYDTDSKHEESVDRQIVKVVLCIFFLLILPTLVIYLVRTAYLFLKRCNDGSAASYRFLCCGGGGGGNVARRNSADNENSPYQAVIEAAANIVLQQQQQQQQQFGQHQLSFTENESAIALNSNAAAQTPTVTLLPLFNFPNQIASYDTMVGASSSTTSSSSARHRSNRGLRRTRTAAAGATAIAAATTAETDQQQRNHHRALHATRSLALQGPNGGGSAPTFTMEEFSQLLRGIQSLQQLQLQQYQNARGGAPPPPTYESAIRHQTSFI